jgi:hypothetical protein
MAAWERSSSLLATNPPSLSRRLQPSVRLGADLSSAGVRMPPPGRDAFKNPIRIRSGGDQLEPESRRAFVGLAGDSDSMLAIQPSDPP